jgi:hypothetical protein
MTRFPWSVCVSHVVLYVCRYLNNEWIKRKVPLLQQEAAASAHSPTTSDSPARPGLSLGASSALAATLVDTKKTDTVESSRNPAENAQQSATRSSSRKEENASSTILPFPRKKFCHAKQPDQAALDKVSVQKATSPTVVMTAAVPVVEATVAVGSLDESLRKFGTEQCDIVLPKVPQQDNSWDCGVFVLQYGEEFVRSPWQSAEFKV